MKLDKEMVAISLDAESREEVLSLLGNRLLDKGYVKEGFVESILEREKSFPTGLPTEPFGVAIPHTDGDMVNEAKIAFASLKKPVKFFAMGQGSQLIDVQLVFMLALTTPEAQLEMLQKLVGLFQQPEMVAKLAEAKDADALNQLVAENAEQPPI